MDNEKIVSAEELAAEQVALQESKEDEVRDRVISEYGFDEVDDADRISKAVAKELEHSKKMSQAIGQKIKWRTEATKPKEAAPAEVKKDYVPQTLDIGKAVKQSLEEEFLADLDYSPEIKKEIKRVADITGVTVKAALRDPYIVAKIADYTKAQEVEEASISKTNRPGGNKSYSFENPPNSNMNTPEGRAEWEKYKAEMIKKGY